jgi:hypothetical protein
VNGIAADAWALSEITAGMRAELTEQAKRRGYRNAEQLLESPQSPSNAQTWDKATETSREKAVKLKRAMAMTLARLDDLKLSEGEFERLGAEDYMREFGKAITPRRWRDKLRLILELDGGAENFARMEIYLEANSTSHERTAKAESHAANAGLGAVISSFKCPEQPSTAEKAYLWHRAFEQFEAQLESGKQARKIRSQLQDFLFSAAPFLAKTMAGLRKQFEWKYSAWVEGGRIPKAIEDQRHVRSGRFRTPQLSDDDLDKIVGKAVLGAGGRIAPAWRDLREQNGLSEEILTHYVTNPSRKSYVPRTIRDQVKYKVAMLDDIHHGPRQAKLNGAYVTRDWSNVEAGAWYQSDDATLPIYYYEPDGNGWFTLWRGQFLLMIDLRSTRILGYALLSSRNYNARAIRTLITKVCDEHGLPTKGFYFERGIWQRSKILKGETSEMALSLPEAEKGLMDLGLKFVHSNLPRSKPIEWVIGALQNLMEGDLGYCGRDEKTDKYERVQQNKRLVESRKLDPSGQFLSAEQWLNRLDEICKQYNTSPQEGKMLGGLCPSVAFDKFSSPDDLQIKFDGRCRYLLAHHRRPVRVTKNGITLFKDFNYRDGNTGRLIGQTVLAWFNPETPEVLCVTDMNRENLFTVERALDVPAMEAPPELLGREMAKINAHQAPAKAYYRTLKAKADRAFRPNVMHPDNARFGEEIQSQTNAVRIKLKEETSRVNRTRRAARQIGMVAASADLVRPETAPALERLSEMLAEDEKEQQ